jgi:hypothetical protein
VHLDKIWSSAEHPRQYEDQMLFLDTDQPVDEEPEHDLRYFITRIGQWQETVLYLRLTGGAAEPKRVPRQNARAIRHMVVALAHGLNM